MKSKKRKNTSKEVRIKKIQEKIDRNIGSYNLKKISSSTESEEKQKYVLLLLELVKVVKKYKDKAVSDYFFDQIVILLQERLEQMSFKFKIPGYCSNDIYQESLVALRYKAIKDYDPDRSDVLEISPFDKFAMLCIRRHLSTKLKASYQNKNMALNKARSIDQGVNETDKTSGEQLFLSDIIPVKSKYKNYLDKFSEQEDFKKLFSCLNERLSNLEKEVLKLYACSYSYETISKILSKKKKYKDVTPKSIDNSLSRIKVKAAEIYKMHFSEEKK